MDSLHMLQLPSSRASDAVMQSNAGMADSAGASASIGRPALRPGPTSVQGLFDWPADVCTRAFSLGDGKDDARKSRVRKFVDGVPWNVSSDFSGYDCPREAWRLMIMALSHAFPDWQLAQPRHVRSCDIARLQHRQLVLNAQKLDEGRSCVFHDINDRPPADAKRHLDKMEPRAGTAVARQAEQRRLQCEWLRENHA